MPQQVLLPQCLLTILLRPLLKHLLTTLPQRPQNDLPWRRLLTPLRSLVLRLWRPRRHLPPRHPLVPLLICQHMLLHQCQLMLLLRSLRWRPLLTPLRLLALRLWRPRRPLPPRCQLMPLLRCLPTSLAVHPLIILPKPLLVPPQWRPLLTPPRSLELRLWRPRRLLPQRRPLLPLLLHPLVRRQ